MSHYFVTFVYISILLIYQIINAFSFLCSYKILNKFTFFKTENDEIFKTSTIALIEDIISLILLYRSAIIASYP